jgi:hypothetical protein
VEPELRHQTLTVPPEDISASVCHGNDTGSVDGGIDASGCRPYHAGHLRRESEGPTMSNFTASMPDDEELEDLEPEPDDAENVKGGSSQDSDSTGKGGTDS